MIPFFTCLIVFFFCITVCQFIFTTSYVRRVWWRSSLHLGATPQSEKPALDVADKFHAGRTAKVGTGGRGPPAALPARSGAATNGAPRDGARAPRDGARAPNRNPKPKAAKATAADDNAMQSMRRNYSPE